MSQRDDAAGVPIRIKVNDRRRFDMDGNVREPGGPEQAPPQQQPDQAAESDQPPADPAEVVRLRAELEVAQKDLEASRRRVDELARAYQALNQDREEFKARLRREREQLMDVERGKVAVALLEAIDELDRCLAAAPGDTTPLAQGVRFIRDGMLAKLQQSGVERLSLVGQTYDPNVAEAADMEITPNQEDDQRVVAEVQAGYRIKDKVIRPARVKVAKYVAPAQA
ncbi:MAG TPA: nucleotide exchange factor GrpE [Myxococcales bacterium]|nr:nucleotide exchange factor GrpE [Myxococcales bacterium]